MKIYNLVKNEQWKSVVFESTFPAPLTFLSPPFPSPLNETQTIDKCSPDTGPPLSTDTSQRAVFAGRLSCLQYWSYIPGECSPEMGVPPTQTPFMKKRLYFGCHITENNFGPNCPCFGSSSGGSTLEKANLEKTRNYCPLPTYSSAPKVRYHWEKVIVPIPSSRDTQVRTFDLGENQMK